MTRIFLLLLILPINSFSQNFIGKSKAHVKKSLQHQIKKNDSLDISLTDNENSLVYIIKPGKTLPAAFIYGFNKESNCNSEKVIAECDSCFNWFLNKVFDQKKYEWKKINENQYVSKYDARMMIELPADNKSYFYTILKTEWNKEMYDLLIGN